MASCFLLQKKYRLHTAVQGVPSAVDLGILKIWGIWFRNFEDFVDMLNVLFFWNLLDLSL